MEKKKVLWKKAVFEKSVVKKGSFRKK